MSTVGKSSNGASSIGSLTRCLNMYLTPCACTTIRVVSAVVQENSTRTNQAATLFNLEGDKDKRTNEEEEEEEETSWCRNVAKDESKRGNQLLGDWFSEFCGRTRKREENDAYEGLPEIKTNSIYAPSVEGMSDNWISFEIIVTGTGELWANSLWSLRSLARVIWGTSTTRNKNHNENHTKTPTTLYLYCLYYVASFCITSTAMTLSIPKFTNNDCDSDQ